MRIRQSMRRTHRRGHADGSNWLSFSDLMSSLLLIFILIMFYIMYQYFDMYEINMAEIARQQYDLDQANADLDEKTAKAFGALSLECSVYGKPGTSYLAVSGSGKHLELAVNHELSSKDKFADGTEYEMISGALKYGNVCSIVIGGEEYAYNKRGFNIVVYDEKQGKVIDRALYDVYQNTIVSAMTDDTVSTGVRYNEENKTCDIWMTGSIPKVLTDKPVYAYIYTWDKDHPAMLSRIEMKKGRYGTKGNTDSFEYFFMKDFDVSAYDPSSFGIMIYVTSSESGVVQYKCRTVYDLTSKENRDRALPQGVTLTEA